MTEVWAPIPNWDGYEASTYGRIRSIDRTIIDSRGRSLRLRGRVLAVGHHGIGHEHVMLSRSRERVTAQVHRLVLAAHIGPCPDGMEVLHINGDPTDNRLTNLRYGTRSENNRDKVRHGTDHNESKTHCPQGHPYSDENTYIYPTGNRRCRICRRDAHRRHEQKRTA